MFLRERATQAEYFDSPGRTVEEMRGHYSELNRLNGITRFAGSFEEGIPALVGTEACRELTLLDVGAGDGFLGRSLSAWARTRGWDWRFTGVDHCPEAADVAEGGRHVTGSATALPFPDASFDVVTALSMTHHMDTEADLTAHFREAARVSRLGVMVCDLNRSALLWAGLWVGLMGMSKGFRRDALISVRRAWRADEWRRAARGAGMEGASVWVKHRTRLLLSWRKGAAGRPVPTPPTEPVAPR